jgi:polyhydroxyalkanoate synthase
MTASPASAEQDSRGGSNGSPNLWGLSPDAMQAHWHGLLSKMAALPNVARVMKRVQVGATPARPIYREDNLRVLNYESDEPQRHDTPLIFVFALVNRPYILDLRPGKSVVQHFVQAGFDTYNLDWGVPADGDRYLGLDDYVMRYLDHSVEAVCERTGVEQVNLLGYCMGGTMTAMYAALRPERVRNLILLTAPIDWSHRENLLSLWTDARYFDVDRMIAVYGNAPPAWLQSSFQLLKPVQNLFEKYVTFYENMHDEKWLEDFFAMETWLNDNVPVAGEVFRQFVKYLFQENRLVRGRLEVDGRHVDLRRITCPVLNLIAANDHLVPPNQSEPFNDLVSSTDRETIAFPAGHIGMAVGSRSHRELWPRVARWLAQRSVDRRARRESPTRTTRSSTRAPKQPTTRTARATRSRKR